MTSGVSKGVTDSNQSLTLIPAGACFYKTKLTNDGHISSDFSSYGPLFVLFSCLYYSLVFYSIILLFSIPNGQL